MVNLKQIITTGLISANLGIIGGYAVGNMSTERQNLELSTIKTLQTEINLIRNENYQLHSDLIKRDNPYGWQLNGDALGNWWYEKIDCDALGACYKSHLE